MTADDTFPPSLWSTIVDTRAKETPNKIFCEILEDDWRERGSRKITYTEISRAVNRACWWFEEEFGASKDFDSFTYVGDHDLRYTLVMIAAQKSERTMIIADMVQLTHSALLALLEDMKCFRWLGGSEADTALGQALPADRPGTVLSTLPPLSYWLEDVEVPHYPYDKTWEEAKSNPGFVIHSSGSTGPPKSLCHTVELVAVAHFMRRFPDGTYENPNLMFAPLFDSRVLWVAPPKWLGGIMGHLMVPLFWEGTPIWPPVHKETVTPAPLVEEILEKVQPDGALYVPSTLRDLCQSERSLELVKKHKFIVYAGAPLDEWVGDLLCTELDLLVVVGSTESSLWPLQKLDDPKEWRYYSVDKRLGHRLEHFKDDMYEVVVDKKPEYRRFQGIFLMCPELGVHHTADLYTPHPSKPGLIRYRGRKDDFFKLTWLTKVRANDMESALTLDRKIVEAMVGGDGKPAPFVIIQLAENNENPDENELWLIVERLNETLSAEVKIPRKNILVTDPSRPLKKLGKGTLNRRGIHADYEEDISRLYDGTK
ncbi:hypothetical protein BJ170DRAFT_686642 [Xylariales sp. AK1849]|nr:hypothetical protein BJ170DRAFT_686642 [Xylariales sp. AK1849]